MTTELVYDRLKEVLDPELHINIVDLGLIYEVRVKGKDVFILMTLTFPGCPLGSIIHKEIKEKVGSLPEIGEIDLKITFDPPWDLTKVKEEVRAELGF
jgi:metal-sulfur cluster biosynthetic enzyme